MAGRNWIFPVCLGLHSGFWLSPPAARGMDVPALRRMPQVSHAAADAPLRVGHLLLRAAARCSRGAGSGGLQPPWPFSSRQNLKSNKPLLPVNGKRKRSTCDVGEIFLLLQKAELTAVSLRRVFLLAVSVPGKIQMGALRSQVNCSFTWALHRGAWLTRLGSKQKAESLAIAAGTPCFPGRGGDSAVPAAEVLPYQEMVPWITLWTWCHRQD